MTHVLLFASRNGPVLSLLAPAPVVAVREELPAPLAPQEK
jgi:hypothetical protein